jgi:hypothetical protein
MFGLALGLSLKTSQADLVYSNLPFDPDTTRIVGSFSPNFFTVAMPFTVSQTVFLDVVNVPIVNFIAPNLLNVSVYTDDGSGEPDIALETMTITTAPTGGSTPAEIRTATSTLNPQLDMGVDYWMVLSSAGRFGWAITTTGQMGFKFSTNAGVTWQDPSGNITRSAFSVEGAAVPESKFTVLLAFACLTFLLWKGPATIERLGYLRKVNTPTCCRT